MVGQVGIIVCVILWNWGDSKENADLVDCDFAFKMVRK